MYNDFIDAVQNAKVVSIISDQNPDGDTCGSALALYRALKNFGKNEVYLFCDSQIKHSLTMLKGHENYNTSEVVKCDLAIACDCADADRMGIYLDMYKKARIKVDIDHHKTNSRYGNINIIEAGVSATCEVMYKVIKALDSLKPCFDDTIAELLYSGLVTDSGGFTFSSVSEQTHKIASELIKYNFNASLICEHFLKNVPINTFKLRARVLSNTKFFDNDKIGMIIFYQDDFKATNTSPDNTEGAINFVRNVEGVEIALAITELETKNSFKVSIRTSDNVDASRISMVFGGGGHKNAAGCRISGFLEDVKDKLLKACRDEMGI